jgi:hypothetical protein
MIDRSRQTKRRAFIRTAQVTRRLQIAGKLHRKVRYDYRADVSRTRAVARRFFVSGGLRGFRCTARFTQPYHRIGHEIADEKQHGKGRENAEKSFAMCQLHQCRTDKRGLCQVNKRVEA